MFFDMTKKLFLCALAVVCLFGCGKSDAEMANEKYVRASEKVVKAAQAFDEANYELALDLCKSAQNDISEILSKHQDTSIALEIVKNASINIGPCSLSDLREKVIPQLETLSKKEMKPLSLPWAVALKLPPAERDTALANLAILTLYLDRTTQSLTERGLKPALSMTLKERTDAVNAILSKISSVEIKHKVMNMRNALIEEENRNLAARKAVGEQERKSEKKMRANRIESNAKIVLGGDRQMAQEANLEKPVYQLIALDMAEKIISGRYDVGEKIHGRSTLASKYNVSPETVRRAMFLLKDMDILEMKQGSGIFIKNVEKAQSFVEKFRNLCAADELRANLGDLMNQRDALEQQIRTGKLPAWYPRGQSPILDEVDLPLAVFENHLNLLVELFASLFARWCLTTSSR